jgi:hypothetical protein
LIGLEIGKVALAEAIQVDGTPELGRQLLGERIEELGLAQAASLELEQRVCANPLAERRDCGAEVLERDPRALLEDRERARERRREHAPEIADHRLRARHRQRR